MSDLQNIAQQISVLISSAESATVQVRTFSAQLNQIISLANNTIQGSEYREYQDMISQLNISRKKLEYAAECLIGVSKSGKDWLAGHILNITSGTTTTGYSDGNSEITNATEKTTFERPQKSMSSNEYSKIINSLDSKKIDYLPLSQGYYEKSDEEIVKRLAGGDQTDGSCSSLAFAYCGNKAGFTVLDFRDGESRRFFSRNDSILQIANLPNVNSYIEWGKDDELCANRLMSKMQPDVEYYLATGEHAAIVRLHNGHYEYLELQAPGDNNGWHLLHPISLYERFGCGVNDVDYPNILIEVESLTRNSEFLDLLGYINTAEPNQNKGDYGYVK